MLSNSKHVTQHLVTNARRIRDIGTFKCFQTNDIIYGIQVNKTIKCFQK